MPISQELLQAYRETDYQVETMGGIKTLKIDVPSDYLAVAHRMHHTDRSAYMTPYNPYSNAQPCEKNKEAYQNLWRDVKSKWAKGEGQGVHPSGNWEAEKSILIFGIDYKDAIELAHKYKQNAFLYAYKENVPRLVTLDHENQTFPYGYQSEYDDELLKVQKIKVNFMPKGR